jgi:cell filamentation protein
MMAQSKYCYPGTDVLINLADIREQNKLARFEAIVTGRRIVELQMREVYKIFCVNAQP